MALTILKGNSNIAPTNLKMTSRVNPTIRNGSSRSHTRGKRNSTSRAIGQQQTSNRHQRTTARKVRIGMSSFRAFILCKFTANHAHRPSSRKIRLSEFFVIRLCTVDLNDFEQWCATNTLCGHLKCVTYCPDIVNLQPNVSHQILS